MTKGSRHAQQIIITQAGTMKLGKADFRVIRGRVNRVSLHMDMQSSISRSNKLTVLMSQIDYTTQELPLCQRINNSAKAPSDLLSCLYSP